MANNMEDEMMHAPGSQDDTGRVMRRNPMDIIFDMIDVVSSMPNEITGYSLAIERSLLDGELNKDDSISLSVSGERYDSEDREISQCSICLEDFSGDDEISTLKCLHIFHKKCIVNWGKYRQDCPMCRAKVDYKTVAIEESVRGGFPTGISLSDIEIVMEHASVPRETAVSTLVSMDVSSAITYLCSRPLFRQFPNPAYFAYGEYESSDTDDEMPDLVTNLYDSSFIYEENDVDYLRGR
jgi:hypothetical protein